MTTAEGISPEAPLQVKFLPAFFVDVIAKDGVYAPETLPHRITLFPPIEQAYEDSYAKALRGVINPLEPFTVTVGADGWFGDNGEVAVKLIQPSERLQALHQQLVIVLGNLMHDAGYRRPYSPHISVASHADIPEGQELFIEGFTIVEKVKGASWHIKDQMRLKGSNG